MKSKHLFVLVSLFIISSACKINAQDNGSKSDSVKLHTFNLYFINGYAVSYDLYKEGKSAVRVHLDFSSGLSDVNSDQEQSSTSSYGFTSKQTSSTKNKNSNLSITSSSYYIYSFYNSDFGEAYFGAGPLLGYSKNSYTSSSSSTDTLYYSNSYDAMYKNYYIGATLLIGIRGYITKHVSLFAESHINGGRKWTKNESTNNSNGPRNYFSVQTSNSSGSGWFYDSQFIRVGMSVSF